MILKLISRPYKWARYFYDLGRFNLAWLLKSGPIKNLNTYERRVYSQNGEDGIIQAIFKQIKPTNKYYVEFGVTDGRECNTKFLKNQGWRGLWMDGLDNPPEFGVKKEFITAENINIVFKKYKVPKEFDLLGIDIDGNDYWVWKALKNYKPRVVVIEYNAGHGKNDSKVIKYNPKFEWDFSHYYGASLLAMNKLAKTKGYTLVAVENRTVNAFFVRNELLEGNFSTGGYDKIYRPSHSGRWVNGVKIAPPLSKKKFLDV